MDILILGAGQAAVSLAARLRGLGHQGGITVVGEEPLPPYQRPPLSKAYLLGEMSRDRLELRGADWWQEQGITLMTATRATRIDRDAKKVETDRAAVKYDRLALTLGAAPRRLPADTGGALPGLHSIRALADIERMRPDLVPGRAAVVIGGGYIGLEAAAVARKLGLAVTLVESAPRILGRVASAETAGMIRDLHRAHGVRILEGVGIDGLEGTSRVTRVRLAGGETLTAEVVIVGIGITPETALAQAAGLRIENGIACDAQGRTSDPHIWAAGDCASFPHDGVRIRLESVGNAIDMAELVADNMLGAEKDYHPKPWFWSDQYDAKLQIAGLNAGHDRVVTRAADGTHAGSVWYYRGDRLIAVDALNDPRAYMVGKRLIEAGKSPEPVRVADPTTPLKDLL
ncbi:3-phenylpropionate/trans-cinnamate dioxygenase ferredoxin reductase subunit [Paracoccus isoporae]|uniref:3-phenylpropionate/trans-cinnamate dioxygenase ferredoxin reductase subunit n=1 Tax=Paracoccus isoporae TaxID=591205 RepID=A0A1G6T8W5_9RHOB|nr:FAD/NAD(P)-binding oxidoreductase [Paracoccus isoporae]SDD24986.1 3-phenylpropionate/trans-cinnamate dioxygenase ferredoxin reductase subunit [Paracoccus isoporae]